MSSVAKLRFRRKSRRRKLISSQRKSNNWIKLNPAFNCKVDEVKEVKPQKNICKMKMSALLVAMSVGASIVIARPDNSTDLARVNIDEHAKKINKRATFLRRCRARTRGIAAKTIEFGKEITFKTANATAYITDRIGNRISTLIQ